MMSESTASVPARIRSRTASIPCVNSARAIKPTMAGGTLETVGRTERLIQVRTIPLTPLQIHQPLFEADQEFARFLIKHLAESIVRTISQWRLSSEWSEALSSIAQRLEDQRIEALPGQVSTNASADWKRRNIHPLVGICTLRRPV